jgi:hypothetical protein
MSAPPLVSVVLAVFDGGKYVADALDSILGQGFGDFECIVINDGSTDNTAGILQDYAQRDDRLVVVHQENRGLIAALNRGCQLVRGQYIARLDADDISVPDRFAKQVDFLARHPAVAVLGGALKLITPTGVSFYEWQCPLDDRQIKEALQRGNCMRHSAIMMRKDAFEATGGYRRAFLHAEDYDLWLRMAERFEMANLPDVLVHCRVHPHQVSATHLRQQTLSSLAAQAAARLRRDTGQDPPLPVEGVNADALASLGVSGDRVTQELIRRHLLWAGDMMEIGAYGPAEDLLHDALGLCPAGAARGPVADIHVSLARCRYLRRNPAGAVRSLARAVALRPTLAPSVLRYAWLALCRFGSRQNTTHTLTP